jgi:hypothetical protein
MTEFIILTRTASGAYLEPNGSFDTLAEAEAALQSLVDVCGYPAEDMEIIEVKPRTWRSSKVVS